MRAGLRRQTGRPKARPPKKSPRDIQATANSDGSGPAPQTSSFRGRCGAPLQKRRSRGLQPECRRHRDRGGVQTQCGCRLSLASGCGPRATPPTRAQIGRSPRTSIFPPARIKNFRLTLADKTSGSAAPPPEGYGPSAPLCMSSTIDIDPLEPDRDVTLLFLSRTEVQNAPICLERPIQTAFLASYITQAPVSQPPRFR